MPDAPSPRSNPDRSGAAIGSVIGHYRLLRWIGEGGMGTVYEGEQLEPRRRVALKLLRLPLAASDAAIGLFKREVQALARLKHPAIATIHESGTAPDGQRYFAMELVPGVQLSDWMSSRPLQRASATTVLTRRIAMFRQICAGISYAHLRGVIHRDLKPSNIMIRADDSGEPGAEVKILDFGLALVQDADPTTAGLTDPGTIRGTVQYMSPEQTAGNPYEVDARCDVYALGVILYELLTDNMPYETRGKSPVQMLATIAQQDPRPPSAVWKELGWRVGQDLETIVLKALAKDPDDRYQSVAALAEDLTRFEAGYPILAKPPTLMYQLRKLVSRHRVPASLAAALVVVLAVGAVVTTVQRNRARRAEADARTEAAKATAVVEFLQKVFGAADPYRQGSRDVTVAEVLGNAAREVPVSFATQPAVESAVRRTLGHTWQGLGRLAQAEEQIRLALAALERDPARNEQGVLDLRTDLAEVRWRQGHYHEADSIGRAILERRRALLGNENAAVAASLNFLGAVAYSTSDLAGGDSVLRQAIAMRTRLLGAEDLAVAESEDNLASILYEAGRFAAAESLFAAGLAIRRARLGSGHPDVTTTINNLAMALSQEQRFAEAEPLYREALETNRRVLGAEHPAVARSLNNFGMFYYRQRQYDKAEPLLLEGMRLNERLLGHDNPEVSSSLNNLALVALGTNRLDSAAALFRQALAITGKVRGESSPEYAQQLKSLASVYGRQGDVSRAEAAFRRVLAVQGRDPGLPSWELATTRNMLGQLYVTAKRYPDAESLYRQSFPVIQAQFGDNHDRTRVARDRFITLYEQWGKHALADSIRKTAPAAASRP